MKEYEQHAYDLMPLLRQMQAYYTDECTAYRLWQGGGSLRSRTRKRRKAGKAIIQKEGEPLLLRKGAQGQGEGNHPDEATKHPSGKQGNRSFLSRINEAN